MFKVYDWKILKNTGEKKRNMIVLTYRICIPTEDEHIEYCKTIKSVVCIDGLVDFDVTSCFGKNDFRVGLNMMSGEKNTLHFDSLDKVSEFTNNLAGYLTFIPEPGEFNISSHIEVEPVTTNLEIPLPPPKQQKTSKVVKSLKKIKKYKLKKHKPLKLNAKVIPPPPKTPPLSPKTPPLLPKTPPLEPQSPIEVPKPIEENENPIISVSPVNVDGGEKFSTYDNTKFPKDTAKIVTFK